MSHQAPLTTGALAKAAGVNLETLRFYERRALPASPPRTAAGYRQYGPDAVSRIRFIKHVQQLGLSLREISELLELQFDAPSPCAEIERHALAKVDAIDQKIAELIAMQQTLLTLVDQCRSECTTACTVFHVPSDRETRHDPSAVSSHLTALFLWIRAATLKPTVETR